MKKKFLITIAGVIFLVTAASVAYKVKKNDGFITIQASPTIGYKPRGGQ
jgi:hypothetical protein